MVLRDIEERASTGQMHMNQGRGGECECQPGGQCTGTRRPGRGRAGECERGGNERAQGKPGGYERVQGGMNECREV